MNVLLFLGNERWNEKTAKEILETSGENENP